MYKWYVIYAIPGHENKVKRTLDDAIKSKGLSETIPEVLLLTEQITEVKRGKQRVSEKRMWPGYILLKMKLDDESWSFVKHVNGVKDFLLGGDGKPHPLTEAEYISMVSSMEERQKGGVYKYKIDAGHRVKIIDGSFASYSGRVTEVDQEKGALKVLVQIFGREVPVALDITQVEPHTDDE